MSSRPPCGCSEYRSITRRRLIGWGAGALAALTVNPRVVFSESHVSDRDVVVSLFLRGGADGLSLCVPHAEPNYHRLRPTLAFPRPDSSSPNRVRDLDGLFGLPPAMEPLLEAYQTGDLAFVHACGLPGNTRSHFDAMHSLEVGQRSGGDVITGWLGRHLQSVAPTRREAVVRALGIGFGLPRTLVGAPLAVPVDDLEDVGLTGVPESSVDRRRALDEMYAPAPDLLRRAAENSLATIDLLERLDVAGYTPSGGATYPDDDLGRALRSTAALIRADVGVEAVAVDAGGWDTHDLQGALGGRFYGLSSSLAQGLAAFHADLAAGTSAAVTLVAVSEFGRNAFENGSAGTDHGHGGLALVLGSAVRGGRVYADWPGLESEQLYDGQDLAITTDVRNVFGELVARRLGNPDLRTVFPDPTFELEELGLFQSR